MADDSFEHDGHRYWKRFLPQSALKYKIVRDKTICAAFISLSDRDHVFKILKEFWTNEQKTKI